MVVVVFVAVATAVSPLVRESDSGIWEIFACGIRNAAQRIQNPTSDSGIQVQLAKIPESCTSNQESTAWRLY